MNAKRAAIAVVIAIALLVGWRLARERQTQAAPDDASSTTSASNDILPFAPELEWIDGGRPSIEAIASARRKADAVRAQLHRSAPNYANMPAPIGSGTQKGLPLGDYLDDVIHREFFPMGEACYADFLRTRPDAGGSLVLDVVIAGDSAVGGVVDSVDVDAGATLAQNDFITCVRESMMAMTFKAPPGGHVTFTLPMEFSP